MCETAKEQEQDSIPAIFSSDRNAGAIVASKANAGLAGVDANIRYRICSFTDSLEDFSSKGFCIINPPYGDRIGDAKLRKLYASFPVIAQKVEKMGVVTSNQGLMNQVCPEFRVVAPPIFHGGKRVYFYQK